MQTRQSQEGSRIEDRIPLCNQFHLVTESKLVQPHGNWLGYTHFSLATGGRKGVTSLSFGLHVWDFNLNHRQSSTTQQFFRECTLFFSDQEFPISVTSLLYTNSKFLKIYNTAKCNMEGKYDHTKTHHSVMS